MLATLPARQRHTVAVSGGFDSVHVGHVRMFFAAKGLAGPGGKLIVILK